MDDRQNGEIAYCVTLRKRMHRTPQNADTDVLDKNISEDAQKRKEQLRTDLIELIDKILQNVN